VLIEEDISICDKEVPLDVVPLDVGGGGGRCAFFHQMEKRAKTYIFDYCSLCSGGVCTFVQIGLSKNIYT